MKKYLIAVAMFFAFVSIAFAQDATKTVTVTSAVPEATVTTTTAISSPVYDTIKGIIPKASEGIMYNIQSHEANLYTVGSLIEKDTKIGTFALDAGYGESDSVMAGISYKTDTLEKLGVKIVILKDLFAKVGYGVAVDHVTNAAEFGHGPYATAGASINF